MCSPKTMKLSDRQHGTAPLSIDRITRLADLPAGWTDHQAPGRYRLERRRR